MSTGRSCRCLFFMFRQNVLVCDSSPCMAVSHCGVLHDGWFRAYLEFSHLWCQLMQCNNVVSRPDDGATLYFHRAASTLRRICPHSSISFTATAQCSPGMLLDVIQRQEQDLRWDRAQGDQFLFAHAGIQAGRIN